jgi:hypothetical protein
VGQEKIYRDRLRDYFATRSLSGLNPNVDQTLQAITALAFDESIQDHEDALRDAATASDKYSRRLVWATWALVLATGALVLVELLPMLGNGMGGR